MCGGWAGWWYVQGNWSCLPAFVFYLWGYLARVPSLLLPLIVTPPSTAISFFLPNTYARTVTHFILPYRPSTPLDALGYVRFCKVRVANIAVIWIKKKDKKHWDSFKDYPRFMFILSLCNTIPGTERQTASHTPPPPAMHGWRRARLSPTWLYWRYKQTADNQSLQA